MLSLVPSDPDALFHLGGLLDKEGDKQAAYQYFFDVSLHRGSEAALRGGIALPRILMMRIH